MSNVPDIPEKTTITKLENFELSIEERRLIEKLGEKNLDYCILSLLKRRFPSYNFVYSEENLKLHINNEEGENIEMDFSKEYFEPIFDMKGETLQEWISKMLMIYEGIFRSEFS